MKVPGRLETQILLEVYQQNGKAYGTSIQRDLRDRYGNDIAIGAIYTTLRRMERKGLVSSSVGPPTRERGGRSKRLYQVEQAGLDAIALAREQARAMLE